MINQNPDLDTIRDWHQAQQGTSLLQEGIRLAESERTSLDEVIRVAFFE